MSITLEDSAGKTLKVNAWNWGVLHYTVALARLFDEPTLAELRSGGGSLSNEQVQALVDHLEHTVLPWLQPGQRLLYDLSTTDEAVMTMTGDDGTFYRDQLEKNYSLHYDVLQAVIGFLKTAAAPVRCD